jgi:hypothetical protein
MFEKLNLNLSLDLVTLEQLQSMRSDRWGADTFQSHYILDLQRVLDIVASQIKFNILPDYSNFTFIKSLGAYITHSDGLGIALNIYVQSGGETTTFYNNPTNHRLYTDTPRFYLYDKNQLEFKDSFQAVTNDCYLLDTECHHSVSNIHGTRKILRLIWREAKFTDILNSIEII